MEVLILPLRRRTPCCHLICNAAMPITPGAGSLRPLSVFFSFLIFILPAYALGWDPLDVDLPEVPAPDGASWYWVSKNMAYNGLPMSVKMFEFAGTADQVKSFYRNYWRMKGHGQTSEKDLGLYTILSQDLRGYYTTVQYRLENGFIKGKIVVTESPDRRRSDKKSKLPVPPGANVASKVESLDDGRRTETLTIESYKRVDFNRRYYENQMDFQGWKLVYQAGDGENSVVQHYQRSSELLQITIKKLTGIDRNRSHVLIHWIK